MRPTCGPAAPLAAQGKEKEIISAGRQLAGSFALLICLLAGRLCAERERQGGTSGIWAQSELGACTFGPSQSLGLATTWFFWESGRPSVAVWRHTAIRARRTILVCGGWNLPRFSFAFSRARALSSWPSREQWARASENKWPFLCGPARWTSSPLVLVSCCQSSVSPHFVAARRKAG